MNKLNRWERDNIAFIMQCSETEFHEWMDQASRDDIEYALELITRQRIELQVAEMELLDLNERLDCSQALSIINRVKEKL
jgi:hypothetical protein